MRAAPAVTVLSGDGGAWRAVQSLAWALAASALVAWLLAQRGLPAGWGGLAALPTAVLAWQLLRERPVELAWDGQQWRLAGAVGELAVAIDLGSWILLRLHVQAPRGRTHWLAVSARGLGARQHAFRAALYSRAPEAPPAPEPPSRGGATAPD